MDAEPENTEEDPKSLEEVLRRGKNLLSDIEDEQERELRRKRAEKEKQRQEEENRLRRIRLSEENSRAIPGTSAIPFYSAINRELLRDSGEIFDWTRQELKSHWHIEETYRSIGDGEFEDVEEGYAHRLIYFFSGIVVPNKGRLIMYIPIEEQTGREHFISHRDEKGPYRIEYKKS